MNDDPETRVDHTFRELEGRPPQCVTRAPGRVNLIGDHVDYAGGLVLPIAIERATTVAIGTTADEDGFLVDLLDLGRSLRLGRDALGTMDGTDLDYIRGPLQQLHRSGLTPPGLRLVVASDIPIGAGLSSSAALQVAVLIGVRRLLGAETDPLEVALEAQRSEHAIGTPCGLMDMYVSAAAHPDHACLIDCSTNGLRQVPLPPSRDAVFIITDAGVRHDLRDGGYARRRSECEQAASLLGVDLLGKADEARVDRAGLPEPMNRRARHVASEIRRVGAFAEAVEGGDLEAAGTLMFESHDSLRDDFEVSCPELDLVVETARSMAGGVHGSRMTGGGFGGCTVTLCEPDRETDFLGTVDEALRYWCVRRTLRPCSACQLESSGLSACSASAASSSFH